MINVFTHFTLRRSGSFPMLRCTHSPNLRTYYVLPKSERAMDALLEGGVRLNEKIPDMKSLESSLPLRLRLLAEGRVSTGVSNRVWATTTSRRRARVDPERVIRPSLRFVPVLVRTAAALGSGVAAVLTNTRTRK